MSAFRSLVSFVAEMLREIFDENGYSRFLVRESKIASAAAYAEFIEQKYATPVKRCC